MRAVLLAAILVVTTTAYADEPPEGTAVAALSGTDPAAVFGAAVDAYYKANGNDAVCAQNGGCKSKVAKKAKLKSGGEVQVRESTADYGDVYAVVIGDGQGNWYAPTDALDQIFMGNCGAGNCVDAKIASVTARATSGVVWVTVTVKAREYEDDPHQTMPKWSPYQVLYACQTGTAPKCAKIQAGDFTGPGSVKVKGNTVTAKDGSGKRTVTVTF
jgi:hypothetical protein